MRELSLNVMDVAQNSIVAGAALITIAVDEDPAADRLVISIEDDGCGMSEEQVQQVQSPFFTTRTTRKVGLGVPLFKMASEMTGGSFSIRSEQGVGTKVRAEFVPSHIDMTPLGDMNETILLLVCGNPDIDFLYRHRIGGREFVLDTRELKQVLGGEVSLADMEVVAWMREFLKENEQELQEAE